ncbi:MAG: 50S ribosomal protein L13 [Phycisphaerae bacterium]|nr:50S ribosomal protein L13 [Phycisphaerae bacterium]
MATKTAPATAPAAERRRPTRAEIAKAIRRDTILAKPGQLHPRWRIVDAEGIPLGRLAAEVAIVLMGKHRPEYTPHVISGDKVIVTNARKVALTGRKAEQRMKIRYTGYPGGQRAESYGQVRDRRPEKLISDAVRRMLPKNRLARVMLKNLMVYPETAHEHAAHNPEPLGVS